MRKNWIYVRLHITGRTNRPDISEELIKTFQLQEATGFRVQKSRHIDGAGTRFRPRNAVLIKAGMLSLDVVTGVSGHRAAKRLKGFFGTRLWRSSTLAGEFPVYPGDPGDNRSMRSHRRKAMTTIRLLVMP